MEIEEKSLNECHLLKKSQYESAPPVLILKFVYIRTEVTVYSLTFHAESYRQNRHPLNGKPVFIQGRLSIQDAEIKKAADHMHLIATSHNCQVKVLVIQSDRIAFKQINDLKQVESQTTKLLSDSSTSEGGSVSKVRAKSQLNNKFSSTRDKQPHLTH